jgi:hypothetical protein
MYAIAELFLCGMGCILPFPNPDSAHTVARHDPTAKNPYDIIENESILSVKGERAWQK